MATTIDTNPALFLPISDTNNADTITVADGPAENGFQTTEVTTATDTTIFANQTTVTINGGNKGDSVVFDNPDPAAGLQTLNVTNLGGAGAINGGNPNANSPDVVAPTLDLEAGGNIGNIRALRTQTSTLLAHAGLNGAGNIIIANGVAAPVTLAIGTLQATNPANGFIILTNNGTIDDTTNGGGIFATGNANITANGVTADLNTGSGAGIQSNTASVILTVGRDINLGDGVGAGSVSAVTGITASAGGNIALNANATITNSSTGNIFLQAGGNFTMLRYPGGVVNAPEIVNNAAGGGILLTAGPGHTLTVDSGGATAVQSNNGNITLSADAIDINKAVNAGSARVFLTPATAGQAISLGTGNAPGVLGLTPELNLVTAGVLQIGNNTAGNITIASPTSVNLGSAVLSLINNGSISEKAFGSLQAVNLRISSTGPVTLNNPNNNIGILAANTTNALSLNNGINGLAVGAVDGALGISTTNSAINLTADNMTFQQQVNAGAGIVTLAPFTSTQQIALGSNNAVGTLGLTDTELGQITASVLRVDANTGLISVNSAITRHAGYNTLSLAAAGVAQSAALSVANLALYTVNGFALTNSSNTIDTLAFANYSGAVSFTNSSAKALTIGAVDGIAASSSTGTTATISTGGNLTFAAGLFAPVVATLTSTSGAILDGENGASTDVTTTNLALSASTGIGTSTDPLETQTLTLGAVTTTGGIIINNDAAAPGTLFIGFNGAGITAASGDIVLTNNGTIDSTFNGANIQGSGNITVKALGAGADLNLGNQAVSPSVVDPGSGLIDLEAGRDINLGNSAGEGFVRGNSGSIQIMAGRNLTIDANAEVQLFGVGGGITATAGGNITMNTAPGAFAGAPQFFTVGGAIALTTGAGGTLTVASTNANAVDTAGGNITLTADAMSISQGVNAGTGNVLLQSVTAGEQIGLGTASGTLSLGNVALSQVTAKTLTIGNANAGSVVLGGAVTPTHVTNLTINTGGNFTVNIGTILGVAGILTIGFDESGLGGTADLSGATVIIAGAINVNGGAGNDTIITGTSAETITGGGGVDTVDFSGTRAQYTISPEGQAVLVTKGGVTDTLSGISFLHFSDQTIPVPPPPATPAGTTADMILQETSGANTGQLEVYDLGSNSIVAGYPLGGIGLNWQTLGLGSFASNPNEADMLMRDSNTGNIDFFDIASSQIVGAGLLGTLGAAWQPLGFGDFSGNANETDMLMRNINNGAIDYFDIQHNQIVSAGSMGGIGVNWQVLGTGDFSGNPGEADMIMRDTNTGAIDYFDIQHNQIVSAGAMGGIGVNWQVLGTGDFSGNANETDLLMRDVNTGAIDYFDIQHNQFVSAGVVGGIGVNWQVLGFGDVSGAPGESDMIMRDVNTGAIDYFDIQHNQIVSSGALGGIGTDWHNQGVGSPLVLGSPLA